MNKLVSQLVSEGISPQSARDKVYMLERAYGVNPSRLVGYIAKGSSKSEYIQIIDKKTGELIKTITQYKGIVGMLDLFTPTEALISLILDSGYSPNELGL